MFEVDLYIYFGDWTGQRFDENDQNFSEFANQKGNVRIKMAG